MALVYSGISHVGSELSDPFGHDTNDIHLEAFQKQIEEDTDGYDSSGGAKRAELPTSDVDDAGSPPSRASRGRRTAVPVVRKRRTREQRVARRRRRGPPPPEAAATLSPAPARRRSSTTNSPPPDADLAGGAAASEAASDGTGAPRR